MADEGWHVHKPGEPVRCPAWLGGHRCGRAQDIAGEGTEVRIRVTHGPVIGGLKRRCRSCGTPLEVRVMETA